MVTRSSNFTIFQISFEGHVNQKYRIDNGFLDNDSLIVSGSEDGNIYIWSLLEVTGNKLKINSVILF